MEILLLLLLCLICVVFLLVGIILLIVSLVKKTKVLPGIILIILSIISAIGIYLLTIDTSKVSITTDNGIVEMSVSEFSSLVSENQVKADSYINCEIIIEGEISEIESSYHSTNLSYTFSAVVVINNSIYVELDKNDPILSTLEVGDKVKVSGKISRYLYNDVYLLEENKVEKK